MPDFIVVSGSVAPGLPAGNVFAQGLGALAEPRSGAGLRRGFSCDCGAPVVPDGSCSFCPSCGQSSCSG